MKIKDALPFRSIWFILSSKSSVIKPILLFEMKGAKLFKKAFSSSGSKTLSLNQLFINNALWKNLSPYARNSFCFSRPRLFISLAMKSMSSGAENLKQ